MPLIPFLLLCALLLLPSSGRAQTAAALDEVVTPFFRQHCTSCHSADTSTAGVRVDQLDAKFEDRHIPVWESVQRRIKTGTMPPKGLPQPSVAERDRMVEWISSGLEMARRRPTPRNGLVRRLTVPQYRNTLRELLQLEDDLTGGLPPDAVSKDGFLNNKDTLQLSPLLTESYFEIAEEALTRSIVDPKAKPSIQNFRVEFGTGINPAPLAEKLVLGADSLLLENPDFVVKELTPVKPFAFEPFFMRTKYRFIEGYRGNDTVRGWREYDSIYHSVFACLRGSRGYPKGNPFDVVPQGLLLRPAIPNDGIFGADSTYGPKANFKISLRELPNHGRFRVTVVAAKYNDGLLLDSGALPQTGPGIVWKDPSTPGTVTVAKAGIYQVDVYGPEKKAPAPETSRLGEGLAGSWPAATGRLEGKARLANFPVGAGVTLEGEQDAFIVPRAALPTDDEKGVGEGDFTVAAWIRPTKLRGAGIAAMAGFRRGWSLEMADERGGLRFHSAGQDEASISTRPGAIRFNAWQHVAAVVRRGQNETRLYVNGALVARGKFGSAQFDDPNADLVFGRFPGAPAFPGDLADMRVYRRPLGEAELLGLIEPGRALISPRSGPPPELTLTLGDREFSGSTKQPAFLVVRLDAGPLRVDAAYTGGRELERIVLTPVAPGHEAAKKFVAFEKRSPRVGVHLGLRRDCGSSLVPVGPPQTVGSGKAGRFVFEGAIANFPNPEVEKDNVNYLAGIREIGVHSEYTDGRDIPRLVIKSVEFEGPFYETWPPVPHKSLISSAGKTPTDARQVIRSFATRAFRRPATAEEEAALMAVYERSSGDGRRFEEGVKDALLAVLTSPQFLFLVESSNGPVAEPVSDYELASKLSYFLWNGPPDRKAIQLASSGMLRRQLDAETERMIADPRFSRFVREFATQWLSLDKFQVLEPDREKFPKLTRDFRAQLKEEPVEFLQYLIRQNLPVRNLIASDFVVANEVVANYYDLAEKTESGLGFVAVRHGRPELGGVLTQPAIMAGLSDGRESNPVKRGAWLARKIIAEPPADPPPNVPALQEDTKNLTLRERLEQHRNQGACRQCHTTIDPWGVALEEIDAGGRLKKQKVDASSTLPDQTRVAGLDDLKRYLSDTRIDQVAFSFLKHLATYATGRTLSHNELAFLKQDGLKLKAGGYGVRDMVRYVVTSKLFLEK